MMLPLAKLGTLVLRTLSKPLASRLKQQASHHQRFREIIINFAQANHRFQVNLQRRIYSHATDVEIRPLNEEKAVQAAADFMGEAFIFSVGGAVVIYEVQRSARSEARKEEARKKELEDLRERDEIVAGQLDTLRDRVQELEKMLKGRGFTSWLPGVAKHEEEKGDVRTVFPPSPPEPQTATQ
ncbi:hypothetical protein M758_9G000100 [Ceratodon purpureus]|uniref:OPA3-like protein n=1 Tax=Ceratodon purpureus TaxID=3225 RepID=A0A8T0GPV2_CERPU|nr:hypothetical protein KC19_9G000100 [Ceratodon purpureus]KAG0604685.1 hypothetical protein M758_9G000100 [Ceratodon purpureus]